MDWQSVRLALLLVFCLIGGMAVERLLIRYRVRWYLRTGFPLSEELVSIPSLPQGKGRTASVVWEVVDKHYVHFWADPRIGGASTGFHGAIRCVLSRGRVRLITRWSPPWTPFFAISWLFMIGIARAETYLTAPLSVGMAVILMLVNRHAARRAAAELRWAFVRERG
jgi:hypothetical protein